MNKQEEIRRFWVEQIIKIVHPVLFNMSKDALKQNMPIKQHPEAEDREYCTHLEALSRVLCGMSAWFNAKNIAEWEKEKQQFYLELAINAVENAVDEEAEDFVFAKKKGLFLPQVLVDTAFLALAFTRAKERLWDKLNEKTKKKLIDCFKETRQIMPYYCNWILFSGMIEAFLCRVQESDFDIVRIDYSYKQMDSWYMGDGLYSDGPFYHMDYYNSYVIQPFLLEILELVKAHYRDYSLHYQSVLRRAKRYARLQEMTIHPDGTFTPYGRSITYRMGAFHHLAAMAYYQMLPKELTAPQVRCALTKVIRKCLEVPNTFDSEGWLNIGLYGDQKGLGEVYISTGSLYLCTTAFLPLGLDNDSPFWAGESTAITMEKVWNGIDHLADHALEE